MVDFVTPTSAAENLLVHDSDNRRRTGVALEVARRLADAGWQLYVYGQDAAKAYGDVPRALRFSYAVPTVGDVAEILKAKDAGARVAVLVHGLVTPGSRAMNRLLKDDEVTVLSVSSVRAVRGDHRYSRVWMHGHGWEARSPPKGFTVVDVDPEPAAGGARGWFGGWL